ncbi:MAG: DUF6498-containing protein [Haliea sp.]|uniref:DUF6498-containing protein n=1 Tax=Haliea sp. TaxID=1932666 RepID=UPI0032EC07D9
MLAVKRFGDARVALPALVVVNLLPLCGVLFFNWSVYEVLLLYWSENIIIGVFNLARFWTLLRRRGDYSVLFLGPFFCVHYGGFAFGHLIFLRALFGADSGGGELSGMFAASFLALLASHGISYFVNFIGRREYEQVTTRELMSAPYARVAVLHLTVLFGGFAVNALGQPGYALAILVLVKLGMDIVAHRREHRRLQAQVANAA